MCIRDSPYPDPEKGTGAVKITPAHDPNDFEVGQRRDLENLSCIDPDAKMNSLAGKYEGMDRYECRKDVYKRQSISSPESPGSIISRSMRSIEGLSLIHI